MADVTSVTPAAIALNRFGLGARAGEAAPSDPKRWLTSQLAGPSYQGAHGFLCTRTCRPRTQYFGHL